MFWGSPPKHCNIIPSVLIWGWIMKIILINQQVPYNVFNQDEIGKSISNNYLKTWVESKKSNFLGIIIKIYGLDFPKYMDYTLKKKKN